MCEHCRLQVDSLAVSHAVDAWQSERVLLRCTFLVNHVECAVGFIAEFLDVELDGISAVAVVEHRDCARSRSRSTVTDVYSLRIVHVGHVVDEGQLILLIALHAKHSAVHAALRHEEAHVVVAVCKFVGIVDIARGEVEVDAVSLLLGEDSTHFVALAIDGEVVRVLLHLSDSTIVLSSEEHLAALRHSLHVQRELVLADRHIERATSVVSAPIGRGNGHGFVIIVLLRLINICVRHLEKFVISIKLVLERAERQFLVEQRRCQCHLQQLATFKHGIYRGATFERREVHTLVIIHCSNQRRLHLNHLVANLHAVAVEFNLLFERDVVHILAHLIGRHDKSVLHYEHAVGCCSLSHCLHGEAYEHGEK